MGRRRYQHPDIKKTTGARPRWFFRARVDARKTIDGKLVLTRSEERYYLGFCDEVTKRDAQKLRDQILSEQVNRPQVMIPSQIRLSEVLDLYIKDYLPTVRSISARMRESVIRTHIRPKLGNIRLCDFDSLILQRWVLGMDLSYSSRQTYLGIFKMVWGKAEEWGYTQQRCPTRGIKLGVKRDVMGREIPTMDQVRKMLACLQDPARAAVEIALYTGLRISEIRGLKWSDVTREGITISRRVDHCNDVDQPKSDNARRWLSIEPVKNTLKRLPRDSEWVFPTPTTYESFRYALRSAAAKAGIKISRFGFHHLRRLFNTLLHSDGVGSVDRKAAMGHGRDAINELYVMPSAGDRKRREEQALRVQELIIGQAGRVV